MQKEDFSIGSVVSELGKSFCGARGIVLGFSWDKGWYVDVRWESGILCSIAPGELSKIG